MSKKTDERGGSAATGTAVFSEDGRYRYRLSREWGTGPVATFVMLNPSTATADVPDPTVTRCIRFAQSWGCGGLQVVNVYALRSTDPKELWKVSAWERIGPDNDEHLRSVAETAAALDWPVVGAWGANAKLARISWVLRFPGMDRLSHLGLTKGGQPRHPLYLRADTPLTGWRCRP